MKKKIIIAVDADGGDNAPYAVISAVQNYIMQSDTDIIFHIYSSYDLTIQSSPQCKVIKCTNRILDDLQPVSAIRIDDTSMKNAILDVANGTADGVLSCGNTGAYIALTRKNIPLIDKVTKPAICILMPNIYNHFTAMLDIGANISYTTEDLVIFAKMGSAFYKSMFDTPGMPTVSLLNIGAEHIKGTPEIKEADRILRSETQLNYIGFIEAHDILFGKSDIIVSDGFSGNVALKAIEGTSSMAKQEIQSLFTGVLGTVAGILSYNKLKAFKNKWNIKQYNGGICLGINKTVVKGHGSSDTEAVYSALKFIVKMCRQPVIDNICNLL